MAFKTVAMSFILLPFLWGLWPILVMYLMARDARRRRASDIQLDEYGWVTRVALGRLVHFGDWKHLRPESVTVTQTSELFVKKGDAPAKYVWRLAVGNMVLAESGDEEEIASFEVVARVMRDAATPRTGAPPPAPLIQVALCPQCGAPLVPCDAADVTCAYCTCRAPLPAALRETIRLAAQADRAQADLGRYVRKALTSGHPVATN